jgi:hypothetical protein
MINSYREGGYWTQGDAIRSLSSKVEKPKKELVEREKNKNK